MFARLRYWGFAVLAGILVIALHLPPSPASLPPRLPAFQVHPLPSFLARWQADPGADYFEQVKPTEVGYLLWTQFPVKVYIDQPIQSAASTPFEVQQNERWRQAVLQAVRDWQAYFPLVLVDATQRESADITIASTVPPIRSTRGVLQRIPAAETRYQLYVQSQPNSTAILAHRCQITIKPSQTAAYIQASTRHELGHALGIWGHSTLSTDALYFAQVRQPPSISHRDLNTLRRVYEQPTRLGWAIPSELRGSSG